MSTTLSCGQCSAPMRPDQSWCSLCYAPVPAEFDPLTAPLEQLVNQDSQPEPLAEPVAAAGTPAASPAASEVQPVASDLAPDVEGVTSVDVMLSMLAAEHRMADPAAGLADRMEDKSTRIAVMVGGTLLVAVIGFLLLVVLGAIF